MHINEFMRESTFKNKSIRGYGIPYNGNYENTIERRFLDQFKAKQRARGLCWIDQRNKSEATRKPLGGAAFVCSRSGRRRLNAKHHRVSVGRDVRG